MSSILTLIQSGRLLGSALLYSGPQTAGRHPGFQLVSHMVCNAAIFLSPSGLGSLFSAPNLSGISDHPLRVTGVRHASTVELSEEGVEASASTVVTSMRSMSLFSVNSPFLFALVDDASLVPLFMGVVTNPAPENDHMLNDQPHDNSTMSDQPDMAKSDDSSRSCVERYAAEGGSVQLCSTPVGEEEQPQA